MVPVPGAVTKAAASQQWGWVMQEQDLGNCPSRRGLCSGDLGQGRTDASEGEGDVNIPSLFVVVVPAPLK